MKTKEIIICIVTLAILVLTATNVFAVDFNELMNGTSNTNTSENEFSNIENGVENNVIENNTIENVTNNTVAENNTSITNVDKDGNPIEDLPKTGINNSIVIIISICGISALYAYKKIRDYNIKY